MDSKERPKGEEDHNAGTETKGEGEGAGKGDEGGSREGGEGDIWPRVGFVSLNTHYQVFEPWKGGKWGGAEVQQRHITRKLNEMGMDVFYVVQADTGARRVEEREGIPYVSLLYPRNSFFYAGLFNMVHRAGNSMKWLALSNSLKMADCDVYYQRIAEWTTGGVALHCNINNKKFVFAAAHDDNCKLKSLFYGKGGKAAIRYGIRNAHRIVVQNGRQKELLKKNFGKEGVIIPSVTPLPEDYSAGSGEYVLWVGRTASWKRPDIMVGIAKSLPRYRFIMIGGRDWQDDGLYDRVRKEAATMENLEFLGHKTYEETLEYFDNAAVYVNTSEEEGFPNTFLHSWSRGRPVISMDVDPDEIICEHGTGFHSKTEKKAVNDIRSLMEDPGLRKDMGEKGRKYCERRHDVDKVVPRYVDLFRSLVEE